MARLLQRYRASFSQCARAYLDQRATAAQGGHTELARQASMTLIREAVEGVGESGLVAAVEARARRHGAAGQASERPEQGEAQVGTQAKQAASLSPTQPEQSGLHALRSICGEPDDMTLDGTEVGPAARAAPA